MTGPVIASAPGRLPLVGHGLPLLRDPLPFLRSLRDRGDIVRLYLGRKPACLVTRPDLAWRVLIGEAGTFNRDNVSPAVQVLFGSAVATLGGTAHRERRRLLAPSFHRKRITEYAQVMSRVADQQVGRWRDGQRLDVTTATFDLSLATLAATLFNSPIGDDAVAEIHRSMPLVMHQVPRRVVTPAPLLRLPTPANRRFAAAGNRLRAVFREVIESYRADGVDRGDLLSALLFHRDEGTAGVMTDEQVEDELLGILVAGGDTPATTVAWVLYELGQNREIERRVHAEIDAVVGDGPITAEHVRTLTYTRQVIQEALRHYPVWINLGQASSPVDLGEGARFPAGTTVMLSAYLVHHDPRLYPDPERFDPDRWSPERIEDIGKESVIPFGTGVRRCPGDFYAQTEMTIQLATIARRWRLEPATDAVVHSAIRGVIIYPDPLLMTVRERHRDTTSQHSPAAAGATTSL
jgi:cytochrome P450